MRRTARPKLCFADWPEDDRRRWSTAFKGGDLFDESGPGAHLAERTREDLRHHYECFLGFLTVQHPQLLQRAAVERLNKQIIAGLVASRRQSGRETSIVSDLRKLRHALVLLCPENDWSWMLGIIKRIAVRARPLPAQDHLVTSDRLYTLGLGLMERAAEAAFALAAPSKAHALAYRDGLLIALLASVPLRRRTLSALRIGRQLVRAGQHWALEIPPEDTKTRRALEFPLPPELSGRIENYLSNFRCRIPGAHRHNGLWASNKARCMDAGAIYDAVRMRTRTAFGFPVNLHRFRRIAGTFWADEDPANVRGVKDLLGHSSFATTETHYITAQSRLAGRKLSKVIEAYQGS